VTIIRIPLYICRRLRASGIIIFRLGFPPEERPNQLRIVHLSNAGESQTNGTLNALRLSSHSGTGRFFERMKAGLNSFD
jgi:hypothetical protein